MSGTVTTTENITSVAPVVLTYPISTTAQTVTVTPNETSVVISVTESPVSVSTTVNAIGVTVNESPVSVTVSPNAIVNTPGTLTVSTTNAATDPHTHAITSSSNVSDGTSALLKSDSGDLVIRKLGVGELSSTSTLYGLFVNPELSVSAGNDYKLIYTQTSVTGSAFQSVNAADFSITNVSAIGTSVSGINGVVTSVSNQVAIFGTNMSVTSSSVSAFIIGGHFVSNYNTAPDIFVGRFDSTGNSATNIYGVYIDPVNGGSSKNYAIYAAGGLVYSAGAVQIGTTTNAAALTVNGSLAVADGMTAPSATAGFAKIYVDTSDGDLKIIFADGTIKTIVTDT